MPRTVKIAAPAPRGKPKLWPLFSEVWMNDRRPIRKWWSSAAQCLRRFGPQVGCLLDLFHVCDYLAAVSPGDRQTVQTHRDHLKTGEVDMDKVLRALRQREEPADTPDELAPARGALGYLENRLDQLDYSAPFTPNFPSAPA